LGVFLLHKYVMLPLVVLLPRWTAGSWGFSLDRLILALTTTLLTIGLVVVLRRTPLRVVL
jgi:hypothetical protein